MIKERTPEERIPKERIQKKRIPVVAPSTAGNIIAITRTWSRTSGNVFGYPFLKGLLDEIKDGQPGMMTLIGLALSVAYFYSAAVVFGIEGKFFFWELATLIDIMLLGHWIEMKSVMGASKALEKLAQILPSVAHRLRSSGDTEDIPLSEIRAGR